MEVSMDKTKKYYTMSIVLLGNFSPLMFQPYWFLHSGVLDQQEFDSIERDNKDKCIISGTLTAFETNNFIVRVDANKMSFIAKREPFELLIDFIEKIYENLQGLYITKFGINFSFHISVENEKNLKLIGDLVAPKEIWGKVFDYSHDTDVKKSGLATMTMKIIKESGYLNIKMEASNLIRNALFFDFNNHFEKEKDDPYLFSDVIEIVKSNFKELSEEDSNIVESLLSHLEDNE